MVTTMAGFTAGKNNKPENRLSKSSATINTKKIRVKQEMIDFIKTQGMTRALKRAGEISAKGTKGEAEFLEGVRRMYGARRLGEATKAATPANFTAPKGANKKPAGRLSKSTATMSTKSGGTKPAPKKSGIQTRDKVVAGAVLGTAALIASRGKATGVAAKLSPQLAKSRVGKALGMAAKNNPNSAANVMKNTIADKTASSVKFGPAGSFGKSTAAMAKAGKNVGTKSEFAQKAMQDKARAYLASRAAAKAAPVKVNSATAAKATTKPKPTVKKKSMVAGGLGTTQLKGDSAKKTNKK